ncbi:MAG: substrate-binding domain-containing protein [Magnetococcales bacterium]|nr:substrate-binding domain-containing protein [Magnetococcales bacterium]
MNGIIPDLNRRCPPMHAQTKWCSWVVAILMLGSASIPQAAPLRVSGTGAVISTVRQLAEIHQKEHPELELRFITPPMGSSGSIKALTTDQLDLALTGRPLKKEEADKGLVQTWIGRSPFAFVVQRDSALSAITLVQAADLYAGRQTTWPDGSKARIILRPLQDADTTLLQSLSPKMHEAVKSAHQRRQPGSAMADSDLDLVEMVEKVPGAMGSVAMTLIIAEKRPLKGLTLDGVEPTVAALEQNRYAPFKPLYFVTRQETMPQLAGLIAFLGTDTGRTRMHALGLSTTHPMP